MTSLEIPAHEMGKKAALMAIEEIDAPSDQKPVLSTLFLKLHL